MTDFTAADFFLFSVLIACTVGGFWYARAQAKNTQGLGGWKNW